MLPRTKVAGELERAGYHELAAFVGHKKTNAPGSPKKKRRKKSHRKKARKSHAKKSHRKKARKSHGRKKRSRR